MLVSYGRAFNIAQLHKPMTSQYDDRLWQSDDRFKKFELHNPIPQPNADFTQFQVHAENMPGHVAH